MITLPVEGLLSCADETGPVHSVLVGEIPERYARLGAFEPFGKPRTAPDANALPAYVVLNRKDGFPIKGRFDTLTTAQRTYIVENRHHLGWEVLQ